MSDTAVEGGAGDAMMSSDAGATNPCAPRVQNGAACPREGVVCEYGSDPRPGCRETARCSAALRWELSAPPCSALTPPAMCPATREAAAGQECAMMGAVCGYEGQLCSCTNCRSYPSSGCSGPARWVCSAPNANTNCPAARPNLGTSCAPEGQHCMYDCEAYGSAGSAMCANGIWAPAASDCPRSSRRVKRDIAYLTEAEREALTRETLSMRLATYEYTDPALRGPRRLGFILEDQREYSYARSPEASAVDLYGYTSMLLATVQSQQQQIDALRRELEALRLRRGR